MLDDQKLFEEMVKGIKGLPINKEILKEDQKIISADPEEDDTFEASELLESKEQKSYTLDKLKYNPEPLEDPNEDKYRQYMSWQAEPEEIQLSKAQKKKNKLKKVELATGFENDPFRIQTTEENEFKVETRKPLPPPKQEWWEELEDTEPTIPEIPDNADSESIAL